MLWDIQGLRTLSVVGLGIRNIQGCIGHIWTYRDACEDRGM